MTEQQDGDLLERFATERDEQAFAELVQRHGGMVHGVARRVLGDAHEAQDVAQAAFLALARKARSLHRRDSLAGWLYKVTWRLALDAQKSRMRRAKREERAMAETMSETDGGTIAAGGFREALDAALATLPERYRHPLVLVHLEGLATTEAAERLAVNASTLRTRLERGREMLRQRLVRRGVGVASVGALTVLLSAESGAAVLPATFVASTVSAATGAGAVSATVAAMTEGVLKAMFIAKVQTVSLTAAACLVVAGSGVVAGKQLAAPKGPAPIESNVSAPAGRPVPAPPPAATQSAQAAAAGQHAARHEAPLQVAADSTGPKPSSPAASAPVAPTRYTRGRIAKIEGKQLTLHVLRGLSGIMRPVTVDEDTEVILEGGRRGTLANLAVNQWIKAYMDAAWQKALRIEPATAPWADAATPAPAEDYQPATLTSGIIVSMRMNAGRNSFQVKLDKPFNDLTEITVHCCTPPAVILLNGNAATFREAICPGRRVKFEHVRGLTPYLSATDENRRPGDFTCMDVLKRADAAAPGLFADRVPTGATRDIQIGLENGNWVASVVVSLTVAGKTEETGRARVTLDAAGNLVGQVETDWRP